MMIDGHKAACTLLAVLKGARNAYYGSEQGLNKCLLHWP